MAQYFSQQFPKPGRNVFNGMGIDPFVDFPGDSALLALEYTQPLQHFHSHLVTQIYKAVITRLGIHVVMVIDFHFAYTESH